MELRLQDDGNVVLYRYEEGDNQKAVWATDTDGLGDNKIFWLQEDGSLVLRDADTNELYWSSNRGGFGEYPYQAIMPEAGFFKVIDNQGRSVWAADQT